MRVEVKGAVPGWFAEKEVWDCGCQSWVASLRGKGRASRAFMGGRTARPSGTAREPVWAG